MKGKEIIELRENTVRLYFENSYFVYPVQISLISPQYANIR